MTPGKPSGCKPSGKQFEPRPRARTLDQGSDDFWLLAMTGAGSFDPAPEAVIVKAIIHIRANGGQQALMGLPPVVPSAERRFGPDKVAEDSEAPTCDDRCSRFDHVWGRSLDWSRACWARYRRCGQIGRSRGVSWKKDSSAAKPLIKSSRAGVFDLEGEFHLPVVRTRDSESRRGERRIPK